MNTREKTILLAIVTAFLLFIGYSIEAQEDPEGVLVSSRKAASLLPPFTFDPGNALYATVYGYLSVKKIEVAQRVDELIVPGMSKSVPIKFVLQDHPAPLVVVLLGISGDASSDFSKLWPLWFSEAGYNVLTFDSFFRSEFIEHNGRDIGISGNVFSESSKAADIIAAFLDRYKERITPTKFGLVGMSYGGIQSLILGQMAVEGKLPFKIDAIQAYSPPIDLRETAQIIDDWYNQYRFKYTLIEMYQKVAQHHLDRGQDGLPDDLLKASIATSFEQELGKSVLATDQSFKLHLFSEDPYQRKDEAALWGFMRFAYDLSLPWWRERLNSTDIDEMTASARLDKLLQNQPACSEAILAADDPFNRPVDVNVIREDNLKSKLTILPRGGHLGYISAPWTRAKLLTLFDCSDEHRNKAR